MLTVWEKGRFSTMTETDDKVVQNYQGGCISSLSERPGLVPASDARGARCYRNQALWYLRYRGESVPGLVTVLPAGASRASPLTIPAPPQNGFFRYRAFFRRTKRTRFAQTPFCLIAEKTPAIGPFRVGATAVPAKRLQYSMPDWRRSQLAGDALVSEALTRRNVAATPGLCSLWDRCPTGKNLAKNPLFSYLAGPLRSQSNHQTHRPTPPASRGVRGSSAG